MKRVKRPHGLLPKTPENGSRIVVTVHRAVVTGRVQTASGGRNIRWKGVYRVDGVATLQRLHGRVLRRDEGVTWARGWDTKEADALRVACAL